MANKHPQNTNNIIKANSERTPSERREVARLGGIASGLARQTAKKFMQAVIEQKDVKDKDGVSNIDAAVAQLWKKAHSGDIAAIALLYKLSGEEVQRVAIEPPTFQVMETE